MHVDLAQLKQYSRDIRSYNSDDFNVRIHRALSWVVAANAQNHLDFKYISLWIGFNSVYAKDLQDSNYIVADKNKFGDFIQRICLLDNDKLIYHLIWQVFSQNIRQLLDNQYCFQPYWDYHNNMISQEEWVQKFEHAKKKSLQAIAQQNTSQILLIIFNRLYTIRNQLMHGGATFNSKANRKQLSAGCDFLQQLLPIIIRIMLENSKEMDWGEPYYPYIDE